ncbi:hypothetical protein HK102_001872, partial [Quaeritorhiza haematococci]
ISATTTPAGATTIKHMSPLSTCDASSSSLVGQGLMYTDVPQTLPALSPLASYPPVPPGIKKGSPSSAFDASSSSLVGQGLVHTNVPQTPPSSSASSASPSISSDARTHRQSTPPAPLSVIFMDIIMQTMDGYTASRHIRSMGISTPIIVTSANITDDEERGREIGVVEAMQKPFTREKVEMVLKRVGIL